VEKHGISTRTEVLVGWKPTYILATHLPAAAALGYTPAQPPSTSATFAQGPFPADMPLLIQDSISPLNPAHLIEWAPTLEQEEALAKGDPEGYAQLLSAYQLLANPHQSDPYWKLTLAQQQGIWNTALTPQSTSAVLKGQLAIDIEPIHPDWDVQPSETPQLYTHPDRPDVIVCVDQAGRYQGMLGSDTVQWHRLHSHLGHTEWVHQMVTTTTHTLKNILKRQQDRATYCIPAPLDPWWKPSSHSLHTGRTKGQDTTVPALTAQHTRVWKQTSSPGRTGGLGTSSSGRAGTFLCQPEPLTTFPKC